LYLFCTFFLYYCVCFFMYFIVHAAFVRIKLMMMIIYLQELAYGPSIGIEIGDLE